MRRTVIQTFLLLLSMVLLAGFDYFAAESLAKVDPASELARMRLDDELRIKRHLRVCAQSEIIARMVYEVTASIGGYAVTRSNLFAERFDQASNSLPLKATDLKQMVSDSKFEVILADAVAKEVDAIIAQNREAKQQIDNVNTAGKFKVSDLYANVRAQSNKLEVALTKLKEHEFAEVNTRLKMPPQAPPQTTLVIVTLAIFNAIYGCIAGAIFVLTSRKSRQEDFEQTA